MMLGLVLFARAPVDGSWAVDILPATLALGLGAGIAFNRILLAAMSDVAPQQAGLASGVVNTAFMMGGALGLAVLASLAQYRTDSLLDSGADFVAATNAGYHAAFVLGIGFLAVAALVSGLVLRPATAPAHAEPAPETA